MVPVIKSCKRYPHLRPEIVVGAGHLSPFHGMGVERVLADKIPIAGMVESLLASESWTGRALSLGHLIEGLTHLLSGHATDVLFVAGDREEALAGALVANFMGIVVAHLHGGDRCAPTEIDEVLRPAISKLAHLHFTANESHRQRLIRMGELPERIWATGAPALDALREQRSIADRELEKEFGVDVRKPFFLLIQHSSPLVNDKDTEREMTEVLNGTLMLGHPVFCGFPNYDPGNLGIRRAIEKGRAKTTKLITFHSLPRRTFVSLYRRCSAIVGNSSSIIIESGFMKVPGILVGPRQDLREHGPNVIQTDISSSEIARACKRALEDRSFLKIVKDTPSLYGDGRSGPRIAKALATVKLAPSLRHKIMPY